MLKSDASDCRMNLHLEFVCRACVSFQADCPLHTIATTMGSIRQSSDASEQASSALAVILTHISDSHAALVQRLAEQDAHHVLPVPAVLAAPPSIQNISSSSHQADSSPTGQQSDSVSDAAAQQHLNSSDKCSVVSSHFADVTTSIELCPFQQELVERIMHAGNTVIFLPAGRPQ